MGKAWSLLNKCTPFMLLHIPFEYNGHYLEDLSYIGIVQQILTENSNRRKLTSVKHKELSQTTVHETAWRYCN